MTQCMHLTGGMQGDCGRECYPNGPCKRGASETFGTRGIDAGNSTARAKQVCLDTRGTTEVGRGLRGEVCREQRVVVTVEGGCTKKCLVPIIENEAAVLRSSGQEMERRDEVDFFDDDDGGDDDEEDDSSDDGGHIGNGIIAGRPFAERL